MDLRPIVITDDRIAAPRAVIDVVRAAVEAGAGAVQLRAKDASARELYDRGRRLRAVARDHGALFFINDRIDVALAVGADGAHLGPDDLPVRAARRAVPDSFLIGFSTDDPDEARRAEAAGADYIGCGAVFGTSSKAEVGDERIGVDRLDAVARAVEVPVVGIGGIDTENVRRVADTAAAGVAAIGAVMGAEDPGEAVDCLRAPFLHRGR